MEASGVKRLAKGLISGATSNEAIIAPGDNFISGKQRVVVDKIIMTLATTGTVTLLNGTDDTTILPAFTLLAGIPLVIENVPQIKSEPGQGIDVTTTNGDLAYVVAYHLEP